MHVFVTGGTGNIGSAVVAELLERGHSVTVLARSDASAQLARDAGAAVVRGDLTSLDVLSDAAKAADGVIQLAFANDFSSPEAVLAAVRQEGAAVDAMGEALVGSGKPFVMSSGTPPIPGKVSTEEDPIPVNQGPLAGRSATVGRLLALADRGVRSSTVRLPRTVHKNGTGGFAGLLTQIARQAGVAGYPGDGTQRWPAVHSLDAAVLFRLAIEQAPAGSVWHAVADEGDAVRDIAAVIGRRLGQPVESVPTENFGQLGPIFALDQPSSSAITREKLGWKPTHPSQLADLELIEP